MTVYSREYYQAGLAEGKIKAKKLDKYRWTGLYSGL